jgi:hypothetical protein
MRGTIMKSISTFPAFTLVAVSFAAMAVFGVIDQVEAGKGIPGSGAGTYKVSPIKPPTTGTAKANSPREHGAEKVFAPPQRGYCRYPRRGCYSGIGKVRDHR